jgi:hypothetical protein
LREWKDLGDERSCDDGGRGLEGLEGSAVVNPLAVVLVDKRLESAPPVHVAGGLAAAEIRQRRTGVRGEQMAGVDLRPGRRVGAR